MDTTTIKNYDYKGLTIKIQLDTDVENPFEGDTGVKIVVLHRRYSDPAKGECGTTPAEVRRWTKNHAKAWFIIPLWLYDHSGCTYKVGEKSPFTCQWDSGRVGILAIKRRLNSGGKRDEAELLTTAENIAETYTQWAAGECFRYVIEDGEGEELDACGGFIGLEEVEKYAQEAADGFTEEAEAVEIAIPV